MTTADRATPRPRRRAHETRAALVELAADRFAAHGYAQTSMRDLERDGPVTLAAIYSHFRNKAELLVEAINRRISLDLEQRHADEAIGLVERLTDAARTFPERRRLRALLVQAAAAAQTDDDARRRVREAQQAHVERWADGYRANAERIGLDATVDVDTAVLYTWAVELGLGVLEAFDMAPASPAAWADVQARLARSLLREPAAPAQPEARPRKRRR